MLKKKRKKEIGQSMQALIELNRSLVFMGVYGSLGGLRKSNNA